MLPTLDIRLLNTEAGEENFETCLGLIKKIKKLEVTFLSYKNNKVLRFTS